MHPYFKWVIKTAKLPPPINAAISKNHKDLIVNSDGKSNCKAACARKNNRHINKFREIDVGDSPRFISDLSFDCELALKSHGGKIYGSYNCRTGYPKVCFKTFEHNSHGLFGVISNLAAVKSGI